MATRTSLSVGGGGSFPSIYASAISQSQASYADILKGYQDREAQSDVYGQNQLQQANQYYQQVGAKTDQNALSRGLANTTIRSNMQSGVNRQRDLDVNSINNDSAQRRLAVTQDRLGFMERYGNTQMQAALQAQQLGNQMDQYNRTLGFQESRTPPWNVARYTSGGGGGYGGGGGGGHGAGGGGIFGTFGTSGMGGLAAPGSLIPLAGYGGGMGGGGGVPSMPAPGGYGGPMVLNPADDWSGESIWPDEEWQDAGSFPAGGYGDFA